MKSHDRFVSLAFCWGEILLELSSTCEVTYAGGMTEILFDAPPEALVGRSFLDLVGPPAAKVARVFIGSAIEKQDRIQDLYLSIEHVGRRRRICQISGYYDPAQKDGRVFLAIRLSPNAQIEQTLGYADGFKDEDTFCDMANETLARRTDAKLSLISIPDLQSLFGEMSRGEQRNIRLAISSFLHAHALTHEEAGTMGLGKYAILHDEATDIDAVRDELAAIIAKVSNGSALDIRTATISGQNEVPSDDLAKGIVFAINQLKNNLGNDLTLSQLNASFSELATEAVQTVTTFRTVVERSRFSIVFQPIVSLTDGSVHHYEALSRFQGIHGESPYRYICFAEETGLISSFDFVVLEKVVAWLERHARKSETRIAINMSGQSLLDETYRNRLDALIAKKPWLKRRLIFELTESARVQDLQTADVYIQHLRSRGLPVCLDDFGAGAASFNYLSAMEVDVVKLDGATVENTIGTMRGRAFMKAMSSFCKELGVATIGEVVDTPEKLAFLQECGIDYGQGYLFGKGEASPQDVSVEIAPMFREKV